MKTIRSRRGSTFLLVLAMLSILMVVAVTLSYSTRLENIAATNFAELTQARTATATGLPLAMMLLSGNSGPTTPLQAWYQGPASVTVPTGGSVATGSTAAALKSRALQTVRSNRSSQSSVSSPEDSNQSGPALFTITDLSSKVNINSISSERGFQRMLEGIYSSSTGSGKAASSVIRAQTLFSLRGTPAGTTETLSPDLRKEVTPGTRRFETVADLGSSRKSSRNGFGTDEVDVLSKYVTVFSQSPELFYQPSGDSIPKVPLEPLDAETVYSALVRAFPDRSPRMMMQFAANVQDFQDADDIPTTMTDPEYPQPWNRILGSEQTPLITEVYPDAKTTAEFQDAGQYVEIYNPWSTPLVLRNWRLVVAGGVPGMAGSASVSLSGVIPSMGYLIITDNYETASEKAPLETGSFLSIFGTRADKNKKLMLESSALNLPDSNSFVALVNETGQVIDTFSYTSAAGVDTKTSYQRNDPRVRAFGANEATPFDKPSKGFYTGTQDTERAMRDVWKRGNKALHGVGDLLYVPSSYMELSVNPKGGAIMQGVPWQTHPPGSATASRSRSG